MQLASMIGKSVRASPLKAVDESRFAMQYRPLGSSGLLVSPICLGSMTFGSPVGKSDAVRLVHHAIDAGINFIDTANVYEGYDRVLGSAGGVAEKICGTAIRDRRDRVVLATKVGAPVGPGPQDRGLSANHIMSQLERSLKYLQTDFIDLYILHWPDKETPLETTLNVLAMAHRQGKIRCVGISNHSAAQLWKSLWIADRCGYLPVVASQIPLSLLKRDFQHDLDFCNEHNIAVTPYQSLQGGLLTGKYRRNQAPPEGSRAAEKPGWVAEMSESLFDQLEAIEKLATQIDCSLTRYALAWALRQPAVSSLVVGAKRAEQIDDAVASLAVTIPEEHFEQIDQICPCPWIQGDPVRG